MLSVTVYEGSAYLDAKVLSDVVDRLFGEEAEGLVQPVVDERPLLRPAKLEAALHQPDPATHAREHSRPARPPRVRTPP